MRRKCEREAEDSSVLPVLTVVAAVAVPVAAESRTAASVQLSSKFINNQRNMGAKISVRIIHINCEKPTIDTKKF